MKKNASSVEGLDCHVRTARLPLSSATLNWLADLIRGRLKKIGSRWRALPAGKIAAIGLAVLRSDQRPGDLADGNGAHRTAVTRWWGRPSVRSRPGPHAWTGPCGRSPEWVAASYCWADR
ncbi:hypothetical protein [Streptomyces sp. NPDC091217]|uniref:hypothetical protein n=1 Tax=Streptomyces sp. NPDC091217 TaxID=3365975 RepID=UPI0037F4F093